MKRHLLVAVLALGAAGVLSSSAPVARADVQVDLSVFYETLAPHGDWVYLRPYGWVWSPADVDFDWRPYSLGRWVWVDPYGWTWLSEEPYGWAVYHYGRWLYTNDYGWLWIPGGVWAPAWVEFRWGRGWVGWAPIPPTTQWRFDLMDVNATAGTSLWAWNFVPTRYFAETVVTQYLVRPIYTPYLLRVASRTIRPTATAETVTISALPRTEIEAARGTPIRVRRLQEATAPTQGGAAVQQDSVEIYRPRVTPRAENRPPRATHRVDPQQWVQRRREMLERHLEEQRKALEKPPAAAEGQAVPDAEARKEAEKALQEEKRRIEDLIERRGRTLAQPEPPGEPGEQPGEQPGEPKPGEKPSEPKPPRQPGPPDQPPGRPQPTPPAPPEPPQPQPPQPPHGPKPKPQPPEQPQPPQQPPQQPPGVPPDQPVPPPQKPPEEQPPPKSPGAGEETEEERKKREAAEEEERKRKEEEEKKKEKEKEKEKKEKD